MPKQTTPPTPTERARLQQAVDHLNAGRFEAARAEADSLLATRPGDGVILNLLGGIALRRGDFTAAVDRLTAASKAEPSDALIAFNLAEALRRSGQPRTALQHYARARKFRPDFIDADAFRGEALRALGESERALEAYQAVLKANPQHVLALNGIGLLHLGAGDGEAATTAFYAALKTPGAGFADGAAIWANLGIALGMSGRTHEAVGAILQAIEQAPDVDAYKRALARTLRNIKGLQSSPRLRKTLIDLLQRADVNPRSLATAALSVLRADHAMDEANTRVTAALLEDELFLLLLSKEPIPDATLEIALRKVRREALQARVEGRDMPLDIAVLSALAQQGFLNEYVWYLDADELEWLQRLNDDDDWRAIALLGAYTPLHETPFADRDFTDAPEPLKQVARQQIEEPGRERAIMATIETLTPVADEMSLAVQDMYEQNPYPRWTQVDLGTPTTLGDALHAALPHVPSALAPKAEAPRVLIAGCGTGLQTAHAIGAYKNASILAVDLSRASLAYGMRKMEEYGIGNVRHVQADILDLAQLDQRFDLIESFGVIHHMAEPERGLAVLSGLLERGGLIFLGIYSAIGRAAVVAARAWIAERGYPSTPEGVRQARRDIIEERPKPMVALLSPASDFWSTSDCRDLIFHVQEHRYSLPQIEGMLTRCGLEFIGLQVPNAADRNAFAAEHPKQHTSISAWHKFETAHPDAFGETYRIWARKRR
jgi:tetratricopeptide (TPR) repeat protein/SAM-dependent methyltransferase